MEKILDFVREKGFVDDEHIGYFPQEHPFTLDEYREFTQSIYQPLRKNGEMERYEIQDPLFPTYVIPVGNEFILRIMWGQGMAVSMFTNEAWVEHLEYLRNLNSSEEI